MLMDILMSVSCKGKGYLFQYKGLVMFVSCKGKGYLFQYKTNWDITIPYPPQRKTFISDGHNNEISEETPKSIP